MSGHSKWHSIKHQKKKEDKKRGKVFSKLSKAISTAAREGGGDPETNPQLRTYIEKAKDANMPNDNIERAIKKGTGELPGVNYEPMVFEGYAPGGVAVLIDALSDNRNRTSSELRNIFSKRDSSLADAGSVNWLFEKKGLIIIDQSDASEDEIVEAAIENGVEDISVEKDRFEIITSPGELEQLKKTISEEGIEIEDFEITMIPNNIVKLKGKKAREVLKLVNDLEDHDDVQNVYANFDISEEVIEEMMEGD